jgi:flagellar hook protein FlgE
MLRSLFSGITGLRQHQTLMDVVSNNISNVNTIGFKSSSAIFEDTLNRP